VPSKALVYWIPACAGMTNDAVPEQADASDRGIRCHLKRLYTGSRPARVSLKSPRPLRERVRVRGKKANPLFYKPLIPAFSRRGRRSNPFSDTLLRRDDERGNPGVGGCVGLRGPVLSKALVYWIPRSDVSACAGIAYMDVGKGRELGAEA
jgi:hypothetical protein